MKHIENKNQVFGFYCHISKQFYHVQNVGMFASLLKQFSNHTTQGSAKVLPQSSSTIYNIQPNPQQSSQIAYRINKLVDQEIEMIQHDPIFKRQIKYSQLKQFDF